MNINLSKSKYLKGLQCHKALWLDKHKPELYTDVSEQTQQSFATGNEVGDLAKQLFPGGVEVEFDAQNFTGMMAKTTQLIQDGTQTIYEATFSENGVFVMVDILVRNGNSWDIYEVKSSTGVKDVHLEDVSVQRYALAEVLYIGKCYVVYINNTYIRDGELDVKQLFTIENVTDRLHSVEKVESQLSQMQDVLTASEPDMPIGTHCDTPYECEYKHYCWGEIPKASVFNLYRMKSEQKFELYHNGCIDYKDIPLDRVNNTQLQQIQCYLDDRVHIDTEIIQDFLSEIEYPINFFDFETFQNAVPRFDNQRPYEQLPFQYSLHILHKDGKLEHKEFLASEYSDPRREITEQMLKDITPSGTIIAFNQSFEIRVIRSLAQYNTEYQKPLENLIHRFNDLIIPFRKLGYYHKDFHGSFSIKSILPAMFPDDNELNYNALEISNGGMAMDTFAGLHLVPQESERATIRDSLLKYCHLDTLAMVHIYQKILDISGQ